MRDGAERGAYPVVKRAMDIAVASASLLFFLPLFLVVAAAIKLDSPGPVLFRQTRIGKGGKPFSFYKFRSMIRDAERHKEALRDRNEAEAPLFKIRNDPRVTAVGRILRKTSLDELPQMINVLKGEMSLVGPRPCLPYEWAAYEEWHKRRLSVLPGCTGLWQVHGRSEVGFEDMVVLDLYYIQNASPWMDLKLILQTVPVMLFGTGAK